MRERFQTTPENLTALLALFGLLAFTSGALTCLAILVLMQKAPPGIFAVVDPKVAIPMFLGSAIFAFAFMTFLIRVNCKNQLVGRNSEAYSAFRDMAGYAIKLLTRPTKILYALKPPSQ